MSTSLAIAAVTSTLSALLEKELQAEDASFTVSQLPPDKSNADTKNLNRLNLFLFQVFQNAAWRNTDLPDRTRPGENGRPPLALNLSYMLTAYGDPPSDANDHRILGRAMQFLNDHPILMAADIKSAFPKTGLEDQIDRVRITPRTLSLEELVRMWGTFMTQYRISTAYDVSVVLIESTAPTSAASPVMRRGEQDSGVFTEAGLPPYLWQVLPPEFLRRGAQIIYQPAVRIGEAVTLEGERLREDDVLMQVRASAWEPRWAGIDGLTPGTRPNTLQATLVDPPPEPNPPAAGLPALAWAPGVYSATLLLRRPNQPDVPSNVVPFAVAPTVKVSPLTAPAGALDLTIECFPPPRTSQHVLLIMTGREPLSPKSVTAPAGPGQPAKLAFHIDALTKGEYLIRLRVDGIDTLPYRVVKNPPQSPRLEYDPSQKVVIT